jgi:hypothetical protein
VLHSNLPEQFRIEPRAHGRDDASGVLLRKANEQQRLIGQGKTSRQILRKQSRRAVAKCLISRSSAALTSSKASGFLCRA